MPATFDELVQVMRGYQESRALLTGVELDVFSAVGAGATAGEAASVVGCDGRAMEMLLHALVALGALEKREGRFFNTEVTARFLCGSSADNQRPAMMHSVNGWRTWNTLTECVRTGTSVVVPVAHDPGQTRSFIAAMHRSAGVNAQVLVDVVGAGGVRRLLDVGGGSGAYSIAFAQANPSLRADVFDLAPVTEIAQEHIAAAGVGDRVRTRVDDLRSDALGEGYDLVLLSAICHMLSENENRDLLRRCASALVPGGRLVIREFILNSDKTGPRAAAMFSLNMLVGTRGGASYSEAEYRAWMGEAGFRGIERPIPEGDILVGTR